VAAAAGQILDALKGTSPNSYSLVKNTFCEPPGALNPFKGISIMWMPDRRATIPAGDEFLGKQVDPTFYRNLRLVTNTIPTPSSTVSWATFAFEQLT
jgi:hypothetical protein